MDTSCRAASVLHLWQDDEEVDIAVPTGVSAHL